MVTPLLFAALMIAGFRASRGTADVPSQWRYFGLLGMASTLGFFALGFFADVERVSFHWPLPGYLALILAVPVLIAGWPRFWRRALWILAGVGMVAMLAYYLVASVPSWRERFAAEKYYPYNFVGWSHLARAVREERARLPADTTLLAGSFKVARNWASRSTIRTSACSIIRSTASMAARRNCSSGNCRTTAPATRRCCW